MINVKTAMNEHRDYSPLFKLGEVSILSLDEVEQGE